MKRIYKIIPLLLTSVLLAGCGENSSTSQSGSSSTGGSTTSGETSSSTSTGSSSSTSTSIEPSLESYKVSTVDWASEFSGGMSFVGSGNKTNRDNLTAYLNNGKGIISSIDAADKVQSGYYGHLSEVAALQIGSGLQNGSLTFAFTKNLKKITVKAESYWKSFNDWQNPGQEAISADLASVLRFKSTAQEYSALDLTTSEYGKIDETTLDFGASGISDFTMYTNNFVDGVGVAGRVMIREITFYYSK